MCESSGKKNLNNRVCDFYQILKKKENRTEKQSPLLLGHQLTHSSGAGWGHALFSLCSSRCSCTVRMSNRPTYFSQSGKLDNPPSTFRHWKALSWLQGHSLLGRGERKEEINHQGPSDQHFPSRHQHASQDNFKGMFPQAYTSQPLGKEPGVLRPSHHADNENTLSSDPRTEQRDVIAVSGKRVKPPFPGVRKWGGGY